MKPSIRKRIFAPILVAALTGCGMFAKSEAEHLADVRSFLVDGMDINDAVSEVEARRYTDIRVDHSMGYWDYQQERVVGSQSLRFLVDERWDGVLILASTEAYVGFDRQGRLVSVAVRQTHDGP